MGNQILTGLVLDDECSLSLAELCRACAVQREWIVDLVEEGVIEPLAPAAGRRWRFSGVALNRARTAVRLQRDLGVNLAGAALALDLLEQVERMQERLRVLAPYLEDGEL